MKIVPLLPLFLLSMSSFAAEPVSVLQVEKVISGDTFIAKTSIGRLCVRVSQIDAPDRGQPFFEQSRLALRFLLQGSNLALLYEPQGADPEEWFVAKVISNDKEDIGLKMVTMGTAWSYKEHLLDPDYLKEERNARALGRGLFSASNLPIVPRQYRLHFGLKNELCLPRE